MFKIRRHPSRQMAQFPAMTPLPPTSTMYRAVMERDRAFDGVFVVGVRTTGIFCRPGCGAKKPLERNVEFFAGASAALHAGYRPCLRCRPMDNGHMPPAWVKRVLELAERHQGRRLTAGDLRAAGVEPSRAARYFKAHYGMTFQAYHRARRMGRALAMMRKGSDVTTAGLSSGYGSSSGFREAFAGVFGVAPSRADGARAMLARLLETPLGPMLAVAGEEGLAMLEFVDRRALQTQIDTLRRRVAGAVVPGTNRHIDTVERELRAYFAGKLTAFTTPLEAPGTPFQQRVWDALRAIPYGRTRSYADVARAIGAPTAVRAVARANGDNRIAIIIPCHRVIGSDGTLTGYGGGLERKRRLLEIEGAIAPPLFEDAGSGNEKPRRSRRG